MDLFLKAIETTEDFQERMSIDSPSPNQQTTGTEPTLTFENRPPQWCIVDKPFSITVAINGEHRLGELEAVLYSNEGEVLEKLLECQNSIDSTGKRILANIESNKANFNLKFVGGREGLVNIGILGKVNQSQKCMLKSPPMKIQVNNKRPRDESKGLPTVTSISPQSVPSTGNFPGRKDRMLLVFGSNFELQNNFPVVKLKHPMGAFIEIRPPELIWWSESLLEFQVFLLKTFNKKKVPECSEDLKIKVANSNLAFGAGKMLKVVNPIDTISEDVSRLPKVLEKAKSEFPCLSASMVSLEYSPADTVEDLDEDLTVKIAIKKELQYINGETSAGIERIATNDIGVVVRLLNKRTMDIIDELIATKQSKFSRNGDSMFLTCKIRTDKLTDQTEPIFITVNFKRESNNTLILDPATKRNVHIERPIFTSTMDDSDSDEVHTDSMSLLDFQNSSSLSPNIGSPNFDISGLKNTIYSHIGKTSMEELLKVESLLQQALLDITARKLDLQKQAAVSPQKVEFLPRTTEPTRIRERLPMEVTLKNNSIAVPQMHMQLEPGRRELVYWKFFNPGTRAFLEMSGGKLQIIGSRRIQMLIESMPVSSKFINASLYVQKNDGYEMIENCSRCKENGIPNVFCVLPKRGREHDYPWITFRITCTSTAKHWKGSPFWIGAEFLLDPSQGKMIKVFSPPIHVQSKVKNEKGSLKSSQELKNSSSEVRMDIRSSQQDIRTSNQEVRIPTISPTTVTPVSTLNTTALTNENQPNLRNSSQEIRNPINDKGNELQARQIPSVVINSQPTPSDQFPKPQSPAQIRHGVTDLRASRENIPYLKLSNNSSSSPIVPLPIQSQNNIATLMTNLNQASISKVAPVSNLQSTSPPNGTVTIPPPLKNTISQSTVVTQSNT